VAAVVLGLLGCVLPLLPMDLTGVRPFIGLPFGLTGLAAAAVGCTGRRRGKPLAAVGAILCVVALLIGAVMVTGHVLPR
jgi:hypothetical protein